MEACMCASSIAERKRWIGSINAWFTRRTSLPSSMYPQPLIGKSSDCTFNYLGQDRRQPPNVGFFVASNLRMNHRFNHQRVFFLCLIPGGKDWDDLGVVPQSQFGDHEISRCGDPEEIDKDGFLVECVEVD